MAEQLGANNVKQRLLTGSGNSATAKQRAKHFHHNEDSIVVNASERRYLWTARAFAVVAAISLCCNLVLLLTVSNILPLYRVEPYLLTLSSKEDQVYNVVPYVRNMDTQKVITETFVSQYVLLRNTLLPDLEEMESRWKSGGDLQEMSSDMVYRDFINKTGRKQMQRMKNDGLTSNVKLLSVNEVENGAWQVEYEVQYLLPNMMNPKKMRYRAGLRVQYQRRVVKYKERLKNPVGFKVISYTTKQINE